MFKFYNKRNEGYLYDIKIFVVKNIILKLLRISLLQADQCSTFFACVKLYIEVKKADKINL